MNDPLFIFPDNELLGEKLLMSSFFQRGEMTLRRFPDDESYVRLHTDVTGKAVFVLCTLHRPDTKVLSLYFFARLVRQLGARSVILIAPYLAYMRQDKVFQPGEAVTSNLFAALLSDWVDALVTVDPHLHRHRDLSEIYSVPAFVLHAEPLIAAYVKNQVANPLVIGPDEESEQWAKAIAGQAGCDYMILHKERLADRKVVISRPDTERLARHTPVLADDIISTGRTMIATVWQLRQAGAPPPVCIGVHGIFAGDAWQALLDSGVGAVVTTNTVPHPSNGIDVSGLLLQAVRDWSTGER